MTTPKYATSVLVALLTLSCAAVSSSTSPTPSPKCPSATDTIYVLRDVVALAASGSQLKGCSALPSSAEFVAHAGGQADATFVRSALCRFSQLLGQSPTASPSQQARKVAHVISRDPPGAVFRMSDTEAMCTLGPSGQSRLCGKATLLATGVILQVHVSCDSDPSIDIAVRRGSAVIRMDSSVAASDVAIGTGQSTRIDLVSGAASTGIAAFTRDQLSLFNVQAEALAASLSLYDYYSLLAMLKSAPPGDMIVAPNVTESNLGEQYGSLSKMCQYVGTAVVFYPSNPSSSQLRGGPCGEANATVYGVAIYRPTNLSYTSGKFFKDSGGDVVKRVTFMPPIKLSAGRSTPLFTWDGSTDNAATGSADTPSPTSRVAQAGVYVAQFIYTVQEDPTPRVGLVAISFGATFPPLGDARDG